MSRIVRAQGSEATAGAATDVPIRGLRWGDLWAVLAIGRRVFLVDPWTTDTAGGSLVRLTRGGQARFAGSLARLFRLAYVSEAVNLVRLASRLAFGRPASLCCLVAEADQTIIGYAVLTAAGPDTGGIQVIAVRPEDEGTGLGKALLSQVTATAVASGYREIILYVRADNGRAHAFYLRNGYTEVDRRAGYYQPSGTDAIVMRLGLAGRGAAPAPGSGTDA